MTWCYILACKRLSVKVIVLDYLILFHKMVDQFAKSALLYHQSKTKKIKLDQKVHLFVVKYLLFFHHLVVEWIKCVYMHFLIIWTFYCEKYDWNICYFYYFLEKLAKNIFFLKPMIYKQLIHYYFPSYL